MMSTQASDYLESLTIEQRRANGLIYTPSQLADFILECAGYTPAHAIDIGTMLDPACGAGVFLEQAVLAIAARLRRLGHDIAQPAGRRLFLQTVASRLHGVDVDPQACALARRAVRGAVLALVRGKLPEAYFEANVVNADFLIDPAVDALVPVTHGGFGFIVGNPPYVPATRIRDSYKRALRRRFVTASGRLDLYTVFIERSLALLSQRGRLAFITPDKFLISQTARALRGFILARSSVRTIAQFQSHRVFRDVATVPCVTVLEREGAPQEIQILQCGDWSTKTGGINVLSRSLFPHNRLSSAPWQIKNAALLDLASRLQAGHPTLSDRTIRVSAGPATGRDGLYVLPQDSGVEIEPELLRPAVRGRDLDAYRIENPRLEVLLPYVYGRTGESSLIDLSVFPKARRYLERHRDDLERRHCVRVWGKRWYDLHDQVPTDLTKKVKILVPDVANSNRFVVDRGRFFPLHSAYYLLPKSDVDPDVLVAVLNSKVSEFLIRLLAPVVKDGFSRYRRQFLATLPIPDVPPDMMTQLAAASRARDYVGANRLVADLFRLSAPDQACIETFISERTRPSIQLS